MSTPHISAEPGDFADVCLMPGDPKRAQHVAESLLDEARLVSDVRGMLGFTGRYNGKDISVMGHGIGIPSAAIYTTELIERYGVKTIVRIGSSGSIREDLTIRDIVIATGASTDSGANTTMFGVPGYAAVPDFALTASLIAAAEEHGVQYRVGPVFTTDLFYAGGTPIETMQSMGCVAIEMEVAGILGVCHRLGARGAAIVTISDHALTGEATSSDEREQSFIDMARVALDAVA